ncbi:uncharacterized protein LOC126701777 [Quercus robur]|uniref:uncharacterized protein LOC126701777 n=1 Tax=Quercus robur TaxID=38942 RepID=UPI00216289BF|nr:uncharacterized protein LOC126701777 [Quercus robur]
MKAAEVGESAGGVEIGSEAKRRKSGKSQSKRKSDYKKGKSQSSGDDVVEVSPPVTGKVLGEETITALSVIFPVMGEEPPTDDPADGIGQPMQGSQDSQDPKASRIPSSQSPHLERTPSPIKTVFPLSSSDKDALGDTPLSKQTGQTSEKAAHSVASSLESESSEGFTVSSGPGTW